MKKIGLLLALCLLLTGCAKTDNVADTKEVTENTEDVSMQEITSEEGDSADDAEVSQTPVIDWDEREVLIPELTREYEIWLFADSHIIIPDDSESEEVKEYTAQRLPGFVNEKGIAPSAILTDFINQANESQPDMILFGGDILDFPSDANVAFLQEELAKLTVPYVFVMGNHDWTYPWEYMTETGTETYRPLFQDMMVGNMENAPLIQSVTEMAVGYTSVTELDEFVVLAVDNSSNQVAAEAVDSIEYAYSLSKPIVLLQHVPFSTENLIARAAEDWNSPVTLGMQVHGGIAPNDASANLFGKAYDDETLIRAVLSGHVHFGYMEQTSENSVEIVTDAAYKGKATKILLKGETHNYFCDKFLLTVDDKQYDLTEIEPALSSVSALQQITNQQLFILGRMDERNNMLLVYDFKKDEFVFHEQGVTMCWIQNDFESARYLKDNVVYDLNGNVIYQPDSEHTITMIEYVETDFCVAIEDLEKENPQQIWIE